MKTKQHPDDILTPRETDVLKLLATGLTNKAIAIQLGLSHRTVETYVYNILEKLELETRTAAVIWAIENQLVEVKIGRHRSDTKKARCAIRGASVPDTKSTESET